MLAKTFVLAAFAALAVAAPTNYGRHRQGGHRGGNGGNGKWGGDNGNDSGNNDWSPSKSNSGDNEWSDNGSNDWSDNSNSSGSKGSKGSQGGDNGSNNDWSQSATSGSNGDDSNSNSNSGSNNSDSGKGNSDSSPSKSGQVDGGAAVSGGFSSVASYYDITNPSENEGESAGSVACSSAKYANGDAIVAIASQQYDGGAHCGKKVRITDTTTGNTAEATIVDECMSCADHQLDLTPSLWSQLHGQGTDSDNNDGVFNIQWEFI